MIEGLAWGFIVFLYVVDVGAFLSIIAPWGPGSDDKEPHYYKWRRTLLAGLVFFWTTLLLGLVHGWLRTR